MFSLFLINTIVTQKSTKKQIVTLQIEGQTKFILFPFIYLHLKYVDNFL